MATTTDLPLETIAHRGRFTAAAKRLSAVDGRRTVLAIGTQWLVIAAAAGVAVFVGHWAAYLCAIAIVGTRQHALGVLMHDGVHYRLFANRTLNDIASDLFCAIPIGLLSERYRHDHLRHHADPNTDDDPYWVTMSANPSDWQWPKNTRDGAWVLLRDALGVGAKSFVKDWLPWFPWPNHLSRSSYPPPLSTGARLRVYLVLAVLPAVLWHFGLWWEFLILWFVPLATFAQLAFKIRTMTEHLALPPNADTRTTLPTPVERLLVAPLNVGHHLTHHLFPSVPWYNLPELTALLCSDPEFRRHAHVSHSYFGRNGVLRGEMLSAEAAAGSLE